MITETLKVFFFGAKMAIVAAVFYLIITLAKQ